MVFRTLTTGRNPWSNETASMLSQRLEIERILKRRLHHRSVSTPDSSARSSHSKPACVSKYSLHELPRLRTTLPPEKKLRLSFLIKHRDHRPCDTVVTNHQLSCCCRRAGRSGAELFHIIDLQGTSPAMCSDRRTTSSMPDCHQRLYDYITPAVRSWSSSTEQEERRTRILKTIPNSRLNDDGLINPTACTECHCQLQPEWSSH